jgi:phosphoglycolate phosphatase-like HAD superfamily hydrolase
MNNYPIMFDLDGTLFQAHILSLPAYKGAFTSLFQRGLVVKEPTDQEITGIYGMTDAEIWQKLLPGASEELRQEASRLYFQLELERMEEGAGEIYPRALETLAQLAERGHPLYVVSNGGEMYVKEVCIGFGLSRHLKGIYSAGEFATRSKDQLLTRAIQDHNLPRGLMVGDRCSDIAAGKANGFVTVGCTYGYSHRQELADADYLIDSIEEIVALAGRELF